MSGRTLGWTGLYIGIALLLIVAGRALGIEAHPAGLFLVAFLLAVKVLMEGLADDEARHAAAFRDALDEIEWPPADPAAEAAYRRWLHDGVVRPPGTLAVGDWVTYETFHDKNGKLLGTRVKPLYKEVGDHERE